jgi:hypothetical protein
MEAILAVPSDVVRCSARRFHPISTRVTITFILLASKRNAAERIASLLAVDSLLCRRPFSVYQYYYRFWLYHVACLCDRLRNVHLRIGNHPESWVSMLYNMKFLNATHPSFPKKPVNETHLRSAIAPSFRHPPQPQHHHPQ